MGFTHFVIAGFLGAGKTTLVNALLRNADGLRIAVLVNEVGGVDIDSQVCGAILSRDLCCAHNYALLWCDAASRDPSRVSFGLGRVEEWLHLLYH